MAVINEILAIEAFIRTKFPGSLTGKQTIPEKPVEDTFYIRFLGDDRETETRYHFRANREYQIVYVGEWPEDVIPKMDGLSDALYQTERISQGIRVESFSYSQPVESESGGYVSIGMLELVSREARTQTAYPLINHVGITQN
ncbi:hypothetical protein [Cohnella silvisoli]|uniref:Prohead protease n=1 Tax=Cohnella silvisoli TaxID=2873699 RepID=A0ABV1KYY2_9BACL|nr:hypothetical protein [Cohnella silvisoli]MCD9024316.1 hypothetical protein [Cohnella silvisoli]